MYHLLFPQFSKRRWAYLPLGVLAAQEVTANANPLLDPVYCSKWIGKIHRRYKVDCSYGGWFEDRAILWHGHYMEQGAVIHLGVDFTVPEGTLVYSPTSGKIVEVWLDPEQNGGWGGRAIVQIRPKLYVIFAHMSGIDVKVGDTISAGALLGRIGSNKCNGNWFPHLHVQMVRYGYKNIDGYGKFDTQTQRKFPDPFQFWPLPRLS
jgi:murein DD-endopeptidase MepM/ murein hydrolase activator NlpD